MNLTVIITALIILAIFVVPFYLIARGNKKGGTESELTSGKVQHEISESHKEQPSAKKAHARG